MNKFQLSKDQPLTEESLLFSPAACYLFISRPFWPTSSKPRVFPPHLGCRGTTLVKASLISTGFPGPSPGMVVVGKGVGWWGAWLQMTKVHILYGFRLTGLPDMTTHGNYYIHTGDGLHTSNCTLERISKSLYIAEKKKIYFFLRKTVVKSGSFHLCILIKRIKTCLLIASQASCSCIIK